ncbi:MAG: cell wall-binding repeat-containing protein [Tissierellia bacterium]|nr:cell wall-binding repeat-containing protein [Tissierellia bacterium]
MKRLIPLLFLFSLVLPGSVSLANKGTIKEEIEETIDDILQEEEPNKPEKEPEVPESPIEGTVKILRSPSTSIYQMKQWASQEKYKADPDFIRLATDFYVISIKYGVDPAVTYAQAAKETNFMRYTGVVNKNYYNPCGLKITAGGGDDDIHAHKKFDSWTEGITAQVHHLALYAGQEGFPLKKTPDPRHFSSIFKKAEHVEELGTLWAPSRDYGFDILRYMEEMHKFPLSSVSRISGKDRYETAANINKYLEINTKSAVISSGESFADSLTATTLAKATGSKLYLSKKSGVTFELEQAVKEKKIDRAIIVGGKNTIETGLDEYLRAKAVVVERVSGKDRFETANKIADYIHGDEVAILSSGEIFADTLAISPVAVNNKYPIFLTRRDKMDEKTWNQLKEFDKVLVLGGENTISKAIEQKIKNQGINVERIAGNDRYGTSLLIAKRFYRNNISQIFADGRNFADSLASVAFSDENNGPIILVNNAIPPSLVRFLKESKPSFTFIIGGHQSISERFEEQLKKDVYQEK